MHLLSHNTRPLPHAPARHDTVRLSDSPVSQVLMLCGALDWCSSCLLISWLMVKAPREPRFTWRYWAKGQDNTCVDASVTKRLSNNDNECVRGFTERGLGQTWREMVNVGFLGWITARFVWMWTFQNHIWLFDFWSHRKENSFLKILFQCLQIDMNKNVTPQLKLEIKIIPQLQQQWWVLQHLVPTWHWRAMTCFRHSGFKRWCRGRFSWLFQCWQSFVIWKATRAGHRHQNQCHLVPLNMI